MRAYVIDKLLKDPGTELAACLRDVSDPSLNRNEIQATWLSSECAALAHKRAGKYQNQPALPFISGFEFAGRISKDAPVPKDCPYEAGTRVLGAGQGAYAEKIAADWTQLIPVPDTLNDEQAAGIFVTYPTSYAGLVEIGELKEGEWCLVTAAAGGVGMAACQIAKALGARVIAACGSADKMRLARELGNADEAVNYNQKDWQKQVMKITDGKGCNVIYDAVGITLKLLKVVAWNARVLVIGFAGGTIEKIPANLLLLKQCSVRGVFWGTMARKQPDKVIEVWSALLDLFGEGKLKPVVHRQIYQGLEQLPNGLKALANREVIGKAVVRVRGGSEKAKL